MKKPEYRMFHSDDVSSPYWFCVPFSSGFEVEMRTTVPSEAMILVSESLNTSTRVWKVHHEFAQLFDGICEQFFGPPSAEVEPMEKLGQVLEPAF